MLRQNMGRFDRSVRFIAGAALIPIALFGLGGLQGNLSGILVGAVSLVLLLTSLTGFCPGYVPFGISTRARGSAREELRGPGSGEPFAGMMEEMVSGSRCAKVMPHMMAVCCGTQDSDEEPLTEASRSV